MGRERQPLIRGKSNEIVVINIRDLFRNPDIQDTFIKNVKKIKGRNG